MAGPAAAPAATIAAVDAYDPAGDGEENDGQAEAMVQGDGRWQTVCYQDDFMSKPGVGLVVTLSGAAAGTLAFDVDTAKYQIDVFATADQDYPDDIDGWGPPIAEHNADAPGAASVDVTQPAQHLLILFRELGADGGCSTANPYRGTIADIRFT